MKIRVKLFAAVREAAGHPELDIELPQGADVAQLRRELADQLPEHQTNCADMWKDQETIYLP